MGMCVQQCRSAHQEEGEACMRATPSHDNALLGDAVMNPAAQYVHDHGYSHQPADNDEAKKKNHAKGEHRHELILGEAVLEI
jgi:hypothetical protein